MNFINKVIIITGASSGIGAATAIHLSKLGGSLVLTGRNEINLQKVSENCEKVGKMKPLSVISDVTKEDDVRRIIDETINYFGKLDVLINNAGILEYGGIENTSLEQYDNLFNTNVRAIYHLSMLAVPYLIKTKGNIVNVSSVTGTRAFPGVLFYCMSKSATDQFTKCLALELAPYGVRVNSTNPAGIVTEIHTRAGMENEKYEELLKRAKETHILGRSGKPEEVAYSIAFLASDAANFITGELLHVDGGVHVKCPR